MLSATARLDLASVNAYRHGSILPGIAKLSDGGEKQVTIIDMTSRRSAPAPASLMSRDDVDAIERAICPGEGACGGMYTANAMATVAEAIGMSLPGSAAPPATRPAPRRLRPQVREAVVGMLRAGITARDIMTKEAFENAIAVVMALRRLHQRRAAPAACPRGAGRAEHRRLPPHRLQGAPSRRHQALRSSTS